MEQLNTLKSKNDLIGDVRGKGLFIGIEIDKYKGMVIDINLRYTIIKQEGDEVLVPNSFIFSKPIIIKK